MTVIKPGIKPGVEIIDVEITVVGVTITQPASTLEVMNAVLLRLVDLIGVVLIGKMPACPPGQMNPSLQLLS